MDPVPVAAHEYLGAAPGGFLFGAGPIDQHHPEGGIEDCDQGLLAIAPGPAAPAQCDQLLGDDTLKACLIIAEPGPPRRLAERQQLGACCGVRLRSVLLSGERRRRERQEYGQTDSGGTHEYPRRQVRSRCWKKDSSSTAATARPRRPSARLR